MTGNPLFGDWERSPRADDADFIETPVGQKCLLCGEPVQEGDTGEMMATLGLLDVNGTGVSPCHRECLILNTVGHLVGVCNCTNYMGLSRRGAAVEAALRLDSGEFLL